MNERGKSDGRVVPAKLPNDAGSPAAEVVEGRRPTEGCWRQRCLHMGRPGSLRMVRQLSVSTAVVEG